MSKHKALTSAHEVFIDASREFNRSLAWVFLISIISATLGALASVVLV